jgi:hypothetical protein
LALPGDLAIMQNQALQCSLQNVPASSDADKRLKEFEDKEVLIQVEEVNNNRFVNFMLQFINITNKFF